ncbi:malonate decarboxylase, gamma subunit [Methylocella silvestris BL2]|uniref:Malonate decarboxylase, gamma subunit n=1 Tax=Methylocella silvestris (strain DSM 15510 / CIP 108128 / LMG 27833 / NCIMB 13906 / BL2) TaxID=395965 RepID=B8EMG8_METSB|nr:biotin-independent malonate decarboxylase subunit gamma [Methylocella silvestris]ACK52096.1 malonate decarboxylase, gamma subunit [Methylocella silvestris BL2]
MTLDEILVSLFPAGHQIAIDADGLISGEGPLPDGGKALVIGVANGTALGVEGAAKLARAALGAVASGHKGPLIVLVDSDSQRMSRRDELLGLSEYLAHLAKSLILADISGIHTIGLLYGHTAAGAFIATALATRTLIALPGAHPEVMDLPSMSRVTKLSIDLLREKAKSTPVFAPGLDNLAKTGAVLETFDPAKPLATQMAELLQRKSADRDDRDDRDLIGKERGGRPKAYDIAREIERLAAADA